MSAARTKRHRNPFPPRRLRHDEPPFEPGLIDYADSLLWLRGQRGRTYDATGSKPTLWATRATGGRGYRASGHTDTAFPWTARTGRQPLRTGRTAACSTGADLRHEGISAVALSLPPAIAAGRRDRPVHYRLCPYARRSAAIGVADWCPNSCESPSCRSAALRRADAHGSGHRPQGQRQPQDRVCVDHGGAFPLGGRRSFVTQWSMPAYLREDTGDGRSSLHPGHRRALRHAHTTAHIGTIALGCRR